MAAVAIAAQDFTTAKECLDELQHTARDHALHADQSRANVNTGHFAVITGDYSAAERALKEVTQSDLTSRIAKLAAADGLARCFLATGRLHECDDVLTAIERAAANDAALTHVRGVQSAVITRARLLLKTGDAATAIKQLERLQPQNSEGLDRPLLVTAHLTAAEALTVTGQIAASASHLAAALSLNPLNLPELQGQFYYAAASTLASSDRDLANSLRQRARRVWKLQGTTALEHEFSHQAVPDDETTPLNGTKAVTVEIVANLLALGATPDLLLQEIQHSIRLLECSPDVRLTNAQDLPAAGDDLELVVQRPNSSQVKLVCSIPDSPAKVMTLASIIRVGQTALELERHRESERQRAALWPEHTAESATGIVSESDAMREALTIVNRVADTTVPVLITGETGTGKEVLARLIHSSSKRAKAPFLPFNCTSMSRDIVESQLFGHRKGAFTGAAEHSQGVIRAANRGTLLLDEIGEMDRELQPKLLRFLESDEVHPVGEAQPQKVDVRIVAATNADLRDLVAKGLFREDLFYRLSIVPIHLPPLRDRRSEIPSLASHYLTKYANEFSKGELRLSDDTVDHLVLFRWPGNIRQLANEMRRVAAMAEPGAIVSPNHLGAEITSRGSAIAQRTEPRTNEILVRLDQPLPAAVESLERAMVIDALKKAGGLVEPAARMLGLSRKGLYLKRQRYRIELGIDGPVEHPEQSPTGRAGMV
jgi:DNA-binding NtrC family response regulator